MHSCIRLPVCVLDKELVHAAVQFGFGLVDSGTLPRLICFRIKQASVIVVY